MDQFGLLAPEPFGIADRALVKFLVPAHLRLLSLLAPPIGSNAYAAKSTTTRPFALPLMKSSNTPGRCSNAMVRVMPARCLGFMSVARRCHTCARSGMGV